jgi:hypothetical protein
VERIQVTINNSTLISRLRSREGADDSHGELHIGLFNSKHWHFDLDVIMSERI